MAMMSRGNNIVFHLLAAAAILVFCVQTNEALGTFGFSIHHKYSDVVKKILKIDGVPDKNTLAYHARIIHHDRRRLAAKFGSLAFADGDVTYQLDGPYGNLYYALVQIGAPTKPYLAALDTGSDLSWISCSPCSGSGCALNLETKSGKQLDYNKYNPNISTTSTIIPCQSTKCLTGLCVAGTPTCYYKIQYGDGSVVQGSLVEDTFHLVTDDASENPVGASITFGCGTYRSDVIAPGIIGLGVETYSLPSILASKGLIADSFSMCFTDDGTGRIIFGDKGSLDQGETPFFDHPYLGSHYAFGITQVAVGVQVSSIVLTPILDSGSTISYIEDPAYSIITKNFDLQVKDSRYQTQSDLPFEYCYNLGRTGSVPDTPNVPSLSFTTKGGDKFNVADAIAITVNDDQDGYIYCLAIVRSVNYSILGQNFMTGYQVIFDRERKVLGWKSSTCGEENSGTGDQPPPSTLSPPPPLRTPPSPPFTFPTLQTPPPPPTLFSGLPPVLSSSVSNSSDFSNKLVMMLLFLISMFIWC